MEIAKTDTDLLERYAKTLLEAPFDDNPAFDDTGILCNRMTFDGFLGLAGTFGGSAQRTGKVKSGTNLLVVVDYKSVDLFEDNDIPKDVHSQLVRLREGVKYIVNNYLLIDGQPVQNLGDYFLESKKFFDITYPDRNSVYPQLPAGTTQALVSGHAVLIKDIEKGAHSIQFGFLAEIPRGNAIARQLASTSFKMDVGYTLTFY